MSKEEVRSWIKDIQRKKEAAERERLERIATGRKNAEQLDKTVWS